MHKGEMIQFCEWVKLFCRSTVGDNNAPTKAGKKTAGKQTQMETT